MITTFVGDFVYEAFKTGKEIWIKVSYKGELEIQIYRISKQAERKKRLTLDHWAQIARDAFEHGKKHLEESDLFSARYLPRSK